MDYKNYNVVDGFNLIAPAYDLANDAMTLGLHRLWRRALCKRALELLPRNGMLLDVATGTGDVLLNLFQHRRDFKAIGSDPSEGMLAVAQEKLTKQGRFDPKLISLQVGDARKLDYESNTFDVVTISWGIRNVKPHTAGLSEILRVLKPGGSLVVLESGKPEFKIVNALYKYYSQIIPYIGAKISGFLPAYKYYTYSVDTFPSGKDFVADLFECGFMNAQYKTLGASIVYLYEAQKPLHN